MDAMKCYACGRPVNDGPNNVITEDGQPQRVGSECIRNIHPPRTWQPPKGGPRLGLINDTIEQIIDMLEAMTPAQRDTWLRMVRMEGYPPHVIEACEQAVAIIDGK
jgi:hypothetical protein